MHKKMAFQVSFIVFLVGAFVAVGAQGALTGTVTASVTAQNVSVTVTDGGVAYGTVAANTIKTSCDVSETQTVTNAGNVNEDFTIQVANTVAWTVGAATAANVFTASFKAAACPYATPTALTAADTPVSLATGVAASGTTTLNVAITTPTSSSSYEAQSVVYTVTAAAS